MAPNAPKSRRYDLKGARLPDDGVGRPPPSLQVRTALVSVLDPYQDVTGHRLERIVAAVRVDLLERELSHGWLSEPAYLAGRDLERALELGKHVKAPAVWRGSERVDNSRERDPVARAMEVAESVAETKRKVADVVGEAGLRFLCRILGDGWTFSAYAAHIGRGGREGTAAVADRFRWMLSELADAWAGKGPERGRIRVERFDVK